MTVCPTNKTLSSDPFVSLRENPLIFRSLSKGFHPGIFVAERNPTVDLLTMRTDRHEVCPARAQIAPTKRVLGGTDESGAAPICILCHGQAAGAHRRSVLPKHPPRKNPRSGCRSTTFGVQLNEVWPTCPGNGLGTIFQRLGRQKKLFRSTNQCLRQPKLRPNVKLGTSAAR
jgi:hypothetical protein